SVSIPTGRKASGRTPGSGSLSRGRSSRGTVAGSGPRTALSRSRAASRGSSARASSSGSLPPEMPNSETGHASVVLVGEHPLLIRGEAGSGKSRLAWELIECGRSGRLPFVKLVADDRVRMFAAGGRLLAAPPETIRGMIEMRGLGLRRIDYEALALVGLV